MGSTEITLVKLLVSSAATLLLVVDGVLRRQGGADPSRRLRGAGLAILALLGALGWWNYFQFGDRGFLQGSDHYHYYLGAKYFPELGYTRLYPCTVVAETTMRPRLPMQGRLVRDLSTNRLVPIQSVLASPGRCTAHFRPERWREFQQDVVWFRSRITPAAWTQMTMDHGFNAPPVWGVLGVSVANALDVSETSIALASRIDPVLQAILWVAVFWAFGWRVLCVGLVFWGTNALGEFSFLGGGYLRQDWLCAAGVGLCALRRGHHGWAGALLVTSALLRIFPVFLILSLGVGALGEMARSRSWRLRPAWWRFAAGAGLAVATLVPLSLVTGGLDAWPRFVENIQLHRQTPLLNTLGLLTVASYDGGNAPPGDLSQGESERWKEGRRRARDGREWWVGALWLLWAGLLLRAAGRAPDWAMACLGAGAVFMFLEITAYYYSLLIAFALLHERDAAAGPALCAFSAFTLLLASDPSTRELAPFHAWASAALVPLVLGLTWRAGRPSAPGQRAAAP